MPNQLDLQVYGVRIFEKKLNQWPQKKQGWWYKIRANIFRSSVKLYSLMVLPIYGMVLNRTGRLQEIESWQSLLS